MYDSPCLTHNHKIKIIINLKQCVALRRQCPRTTVIYLRFTRRLTQNAHNPFQSAPTHQSYEHFALDKYRTSNSAVGSQYEAIFLSFLLLVVVCRQESETSFFPPAQSIAWRLRGRRRRQRLVPNPVRHHTPQPPCRAWNDPRKCYCKSQFPRQRR